MHRYRIVAQISLILSILNLVLSTPIVVQEIHEARGDETGVAEDVPAMPERPDELEVASDRPTSSPPSPDAIASPQHSSLSDGSTSSGYPVPHLSSDSSDSGYSWLLVRPPRLSLSPHPPASSDESASPHSSGSGPSEIPVPGLLHHGLAFPNPPSSGSSGVAETAALAWFQGFEQMTSPSWSQHTASEPAMTENYSPSERFTPSHHPSSSTSTDPVSGHSDGSLSTHSSSTALDGLAPSHNSISEGAPPSPPENAKFFNENMIKKLKIIAGVTIIGGIIAGIAGSHIKHQHRDCQDS